MGVWVQVLHITYAEVKGIYWGDWEFLIYAYHALLCLLYVPPPPPLPPYHMLQPSPFSG